MRRDGARRGLLTLPRRLLPRRMHLTVRGDRREWRATRPTAVRVNSRMTSTHGAETAAERWLGLVDTGKEASSWDEAASMFLAGVTRAEWVSAISSALGSYGKFKERESPLLSRPSRFQTRLMASTSCCNST